MRVPVITTHTGAANAMTQSAMHSWVPIILEYERFFGTVAHGTLPRQVVHTSESPRLIKRPPNSAAWVSAFPENETPSSPNLMPYSFTSVKVEFYQVRPDGFALETARARVQRAERRYSGL